VICEGAGSPAEINLRATDLANMGLARAAHMPVILVGDIDRGGLLAHLFGTLAVLERDDQLLVAGFVVNKFRGDPALLEPGLRQLERLTGRPTYGVLPYVEDLWLDTEDSLSVVPGRVVGAPQPPRGAEWLRIAAIRLPRTSNSTDVEALACEPGVLVRWTVEPTDVDDSDVVVIPGTKATVADLAWLRDRGLTDAVSRHARSGKPVLGICGGFQMLCRRIEDRVEFKGGGESAAGVVDGLGLLDADIEFSEQKTLRRCAEPLGGYEIHHGQVRRSAEDNWADIGIRRGAVYGTHWHGLFDNDEFRRDWLTESALAAGRGGFVVAEDVDVVARRDAQLDTVADLLAAHLDLDALWTLLDSGPPDRPFVVSRLAQ
jgi:adenosylcobyric acid synthase